MFLGWLPDIMCSLGRSMHFAHPLPVFLTNCPAWKAKHGRAAKGIRLLHRWHECYVEASAVLASSQNTIILIMGTPKKVPLI